MRVVALFYHLTKSSITTHLFIIKLINLNQNYSTSLKIKKPSMEDLPKTQVAQRQACVELNDNTQRSFGETGGSLSKGRAKSTGQSQFQNWKKQ